MTFVKLLLLLSFASYGQVKNVKANELLTSKYAGVYSYGTNVEKGKVGTIFIYPETDSTILFYIDLNRGAPFYNKGSIYSRVKISSATGVFYPNSNYAENSCKWTFHFTKNSLAIRIRIVDEEDAYDCGTGSSVYADGKYRKTSLKCPAFFQDKEGRKTYFETTKPEDYYKK